MSSGTRRLNTSLWGISSAGRALAWHARGQRFDPAILHQKALYFVGSTVLFFLLKLFFGGCIASPAPFLGFCRRFLYNPQLLTLHRFKKECLQAGFSAGCCIIPFNVRRKVEVEGNVELITPLLCRSFGSVLQQGMLVRLVQIQADLSLFSQRTPHLRAIIRCHGT